MERGTGEGEKVITTFSFQCSSLYIKNMSGEEKIDLLRGQYLSAVLCFHLTIIQKKNAAVAYCLVMKERTRS